MSTDVPICSFCGKDRDRVRKLVAGPNVYICDECVDLCCEILTEDYKSTMEPDQLGDAPFYRRYLANTPSSSAFLPPILYVVAGILVGLLFAHLRR